jgi:hypothetical protein
MRAALALSLLLALAPLATRVSAQPDLDGPWTEAEAPEHRVLPSQVKVAYLLLQDLQGNRNQTIDDGAKTDLATDEEWRALDAYLKKKEADWGVKSVTNLSPKDFPSPARYAFFCIEKALFMDEYGWKPEQVHDDFLDVTKASVRGQPVADARVFVQTIRPLDGAKGVVYAGVPGYGNTHAHLYDAAATLVSKGSTVVLGDQYWAGLTTGPDVHRGGVPSGETIALTTYDVAAYAHAAFPDQHLAVIGHSLGGGLGVWGMSYLNGRGELSARITDGSGRTIEGDALVPRDTPGAPLSAFLEPTPSVRDDAIWFAGKIPGLGTLELPVWLQQTGEKDLPTLRSVLEGVWSQAEAMTAVLPFATEIVDAVKSGNGPRNLMVAFHSFEDDLAYFSPIRDMHEARVAAGIPSDLTVAPGSVHVLLSVPALSRQAAEFVHERMAAWFGTGKADLGVRVAPVVVPQQVPASPGLAQQILGVLHSALGRIGGTPSGDGAPDTALATSVKEAQAAWSRPARSSGMSALLGARVAGATDRDRADER